MAGIWLLSAGHQAPVAAQNGTGQRAAAGNEIHDYSLESPVLPGDIAPTPLVAGEPYPYGYDPGYVGCTDPGCGGCASHGVSSCGMGLWIRADYLLWWEKGIDITPLATTSTGNPPAADVGVLGVDTTRILAGGHVNDSPLSGFRIELGSWLNPSYTVGIFARYFTAGDREVRFSADPNSHRFLARPFFNLATGSEDAVLLTNPGDREGSIDIDFGGRVDGWEILMRSCGYVGSNYRLDYVFGYRRLEMEEHLAINSRSRVLPGSPSGIADQVTVGNDTFRTNNDFDGFDFGIAGHSREGCWSLDVLAKVALGNMREQVDISGFAVVDTPGLPQQNLVGALLTQETNIGTFEQDEFAWIPEVNVNIGYSITPSLDVTIGYSLIYVDEALQLADTIDRVIDPALIGDLAPLAGDRPQPMLEERDYWLQGINFGLTGRF